LSLTFLLPEKESGKEKQAAVKLLRVTAPYAVEPFTIHQYGARLSLSFASLIGEQNAPSNFQQYIFRQIEGSESTVVYLQ
jgi:hypothetical protein